MDAVRPPAVAGTFYPATADALAAVVDELLAVAGAAAPQDARPPLAIVAPHAGYVYSGPVAASAFAVLPRGGLRRVVLAGPSHFVPLSGLAVPTAAALATPLGRLPVWEDGRRTVLALPGVLADDLPHAREHSLEVELPFLQRRLGEVEVLPLVVGDAGPALVARVLESVWPAPGVALVVSSDLSHYLSHEAARRRDGATAEQILALGPPLSPHQACGAAPLNGLLHAAQRRGLQGRLLDLRTSGDTAGDRSRVVGYGAFSFS
jgi:AmmeMemoRadiSam system protein B